MTACVLDQVKLRPCKKGSLFDIAALPFPACPVALLEPLASSCNNLQTSTMYVSPPTSSHLTPPPATAIAEYACWLHKFPMSLWLTVPPLSFSQLQANVLQSLQFPSHSAMFIFLWTVFVTAIVVLLLAIRSTYSARLAGFKTPLVDRLRRPAFRAVKWRDEEGGGAVCFSRYS